MRHLKAFHVFHLAATSTSFTEAAEKLCITHGAVSKQIKTLEQHLGQSLFHRHGRSVVLSEQGELLKHYTAQAFAALDAGVQQLAQHQQPYLEISCEPTLTMRWLMPRLSSFYASHPEADVRLSTAGGPVTLGSSGISLAIRRDDFTLNPAYSRLELVEEWVGPVMSPAYWRQIEGQLSKIKRLHSQTRPEAWDDWLLQSGRSATPGVGSQQRFLHFYFCLQAAADGLGAAIGSYPLVADDLQRGNLIAPFGFTASGRRYLLIGQPDTTTTPLESDFSHWLQAQLAPCVPAAEYRQEKKAR